MIRVKKIISNGFNQVSGIFPWARIDRSCFRPRALAQTGWGVIGFILPLDPSSCLSEHN